MSNPTWPASLPSPTSQNASYAPFSDNVLFTNMETGAPKWRRRFTNVPMAAQLQVMLDENQMAILDAFIESTLQDVGPFDWIDFRDGSVATYVFQHRPTYTLAAMGANLWSANLQLMKLP